MLGGLAGGIPDPLPGGDPLPQFREAFLILAGTLTLLLGGPGRLAVDRRRQAAPADLRADPTSTVPRLRP